MRPELMAAMAQQRMPAPPQMPEHDDAAQDMQLIQQALAQRDQQQALQQPQMQPGGGSAGPAQGDVFRQALNIAAQELGQGAAPQAIQQRAVQILQIAGVIPQQGQGAPGGQPMPPQAPQGGPQGGAPMPPPGGMPQRPGGM